jgi:hypothetical protein
LTQNRRVEKVLHADSDAADFIAVGWSDAAPVVPIARLPKNRSAGFVERGVVARDDVCVCRSCSAETSTPLAIVTVQS